VFAEVREKSKALIAFLASMWLLTSVRQKMLLKIVWSYIGLAAERTRMRLFSAMRSFFMHLQIK
jgi:hypothetical protein